MTGKRLLLLGFVVVLLVVIPLTVYLVRQQQKLGVGAAPNTILSFSPSTKSVAVGDTFTLNVNMSPGGNEVSFIKLTINFDPAKLQPSALGSACPAHPDFVICPNPLIFSGNPLQGPTVGANSISVTLSVGSDPAKAIKTAETIATVGFKAKEATTAPTAVSFGTDNQVLSIANADQFNENVLLRSDSTSSITITSTSATPTPTPAGSTGGTSGTAPVCSALAVDRQATGTAPFSLTFTGQGNDSDGTISKATFNFGDGTITDVTTGGNLGTANVNVPISHTYNNAGSFTAKVTFTDNSGNVSQDTSACSKNVTVNAAASSGGSGGTNQVVTVQATPAASASATPGATFTPSPTPIAQLPPSGPADLIRNFGAIGAVASILGFIIFFAL